MNFSEDWKSPWPISGVIAAPKLLTNPPYVLPSTVFSPSSPPTILVSSPSLSFPTAIPLPATIFRDTLHGYLSGGIEDDFVPLSVQRRIVSYILPDHDTGDPALANNLRALRCRDGSTFVIFFPTGANGDKIAFFGVSMKHEEDGRAELLGGRVGGVFKQSVGYRHDCHRIMRIEVCPVNEHVDVSEDSTVEGYVLATTLYSVNWFRVEMRCLDPKRPRHMPFLVPMAKQGFKSCVVHACWNPYFVEESVVLLESGELICINLESKRGSKVDISSEGVSHGDWLGCEFGAQPWVLIVASSKVVFVVDLRFKGAMRSNILAKAGIQDSYGAVHSMKNDRFLTFCCAEFDRMYFTAVTEHHVFLYNVQQPLSPLLTWDHGIGRPCHVSMFKLLEIRLPEVLSTSSKPCYAILVGSFWTSKFKLFPYGSSLKDDGALDGSSLYAWELPSSISLSGRECGLADYVLRDEDCPNEELKHNTNCPIKKELVLGFCIFPRNNTPLLPESYKTGEFDLMRFISSGNIELQRYCTASRFSKPPISKEISKSLVTVNHSWDEEEELSTITYHLNFKFLLGYMNSKLYETLIEAMYKPQTFFSVERGIEFNPVLWELISTKYASISPMISESICDASLPASIHEITSRRMLASLPPTLLYLTFSTYPELFDEQGGNFLEFFKAPSMLAKQNIPSFLTGLPSDRGERWSKKDLRGASLVGPVLPLPALLTLEQLSCDYDYEDHAGLKQSSNGNLLVKQCSMTRNLVFPEISLSESGIFNVWDSSQELQNEKPFFTYEVGARKFVTKPNAKQLNYCDVSKELNESLPSVSDTTFEDENFNTFICGINESYTTKLVQASELEMFHDIMPVRLELDSPDITFSADEHKFYECLSRQFLKWQTNYKPYQDFCISSKLTKKAS